MIKSQSQTTVRFVFICPWQLWSVMEGCLLKICSRDGKDAMDSLHGGWVSDLRFSPDNSLLVSTGGYVKVRHRRKRHADCRARFSAPEFQLVTISDPCVCIHGDVLTVSQLIIISACVSQERRASTQAYINTPHQIPGRLA